MAYEHDHESRLQLSALMDGQLDAASLAQCLAQVGDEPELMSAWASYQVVGAALRGEHAPVRVRPEAFVARLRLRLDGDAVVPEARHQPVLADVGGGRVESANDGVFRWKMVAGLASFAAVAAVAWGALQSAVPTGIDRSALMAQGVERPTLVRMGQVSGFASAVPATRFASDAPTGDADVMLRDARLDEILQAHGAYAAGVSLDGGAMFMRNAAMDRAEP